MTVNPGTVAHHCQTAARQVFCLFLEPLPRGGERGYSSYYAGNCQERYPLFPVLPRASSLILFIRTEFFPQLLVNILFGVFKKMSRVIGN